jgi:hypothetical protein
MAYVDTSVLAAYYCPEPLSGAAQRAVLGARPPVLSPLVDVELASAVSLKVRTGEMDRGSAAMVLGRFQSHREEGRFASVPVSAREFAMAWKWLSTFSSPLRAADALHIAVAFSNDLLLLTADRVQAAAAKRFGVRCRLVR